ncbi:MAG: hypothetical protein WC254_03805 [Candidatus Woesearchaeota archaeon]|jgi:hypothetical protein
MNKLAPLIGGFFAVSVYAQQSVPQFFAQPERSLSIISSAQAAELVLTVPEMLGVKEKIKLADTYSSRSQFGLAYITLREAEQLAQGTFTDYIRPRIQTSLTALQATRDTYKVNLTVVDKTNSGRAESLQDSLVAKSYVSGVQMVESGGAYVITLQINSINSEVVTSSQSHVINIPVGTERITNGEYIAQRDTVNVLCQQSAANHTAAIGFTLDAVDGAVDTFRSAGSNSGIGIIMGLAQMVEAGERRNTSDNSHSECDEAMQRLGQIPLFTTDIRTQPFQYEEKTITTKAYVNLQIIFSGPQGFLETSSPLELTVINEDVVRPEILSVGIRGDPQVPVTEREMLNATFLKVGVEFYKRVNEGKGLWDVIVLQEAQRKTGLSALDAVTQVYFDVYTPEIRLVAQEYIINHTSLTADQLKVH